MRMTTNQAQLTEAYNQLSTELKRLASSFFRTNPQDAEDALQQLWINLSNTDTKDQIKDIKPFIKASLYNCCINRLKKRLREQHKIEHYYRLYVSSAEVVCEQEDIDQNRLDLVAKFTEQLHPRQQAVFSLILQGKSIKEIALIQNNTYNTTKHNRKILIEKLEQFFKNLNEEFRYERK